MLIQLGWHVNHECSWINDYSYHHKPPVHPTDLGTIPKTLFFGQNPKIWNSNTLESHTLEFTNCENNLFFSNLAVFDKKNLCKMAWIEKIVPVLSEIVIFHKKSPFYKLEIGRNCQKWPNFKPVQAKFSLEYTLNWCNSHFAWNQAIFDQKWPS